MADIDAAVRDLETIQMILVRMHALLAHQPMSAFERGRVDSYFDAFASDLVGLEEYLRGVAAEPDPRPAQNLR